MLMNIQIIGIIFGIGMLYLTYIYFRRKEFNTIDALFWLIIWLGFIILLIFSNSLNLILESLSIQSAMDLFTMIGFVVMMMIVFHLYISWRRLGKKIELLVRKIAIKKAENNK